jgi:hypothetical protein
MIRTIIACGIVLPMATRTSKPAKRKPVSLQVVISELQLILDLSDESPKDPRLPQLVADAREDVLEALRKIHKGDDLPDEKSPRPPQP